MKREHKWATGVAYEKDGKTMISFHHAMPFGATASVEAWHLIGDLLLDIAREQLHLPIFRYVDDYFCAESKETMEHSMRMFARMVRALLGESAVADSKLFCGDKLVILGILVSLLTCHASHLHETQQSC